MSSQEGSLITRLCKAENPRDLNKWEERDGYYVAACRVSAADVPALINIARKWSDVEELRGLERYAPEQDEPDLLPITAWRTLADLKAEAAAEPLADMLRELGDEEDDWSLEELPHVFGKIGKSSIDPLTRLGRDKSVTDFVRSIAVSGLRYVAQYHPHTRDGIVATLTEMMASASEDQMLVNTTLLTELVELQAVEAAEPIERAFAADLVDVGMMGDWEVVRRRLGVQGLGLPMPKNPHNSVEEIRTHMGIGVFSERPIYGLSEDKFDDEAATTYLERTYDAFAKSAEAQHVIARFDHLQWSDSLIRFGLDYSGEVVDAMTLATVEEFLFEYVPRKVSTDASSAAAIVYELTMFWQFLDRVYQLPEANSIVAWLETDELVPQLEEAMSDPANFGMAKAMFMRGQATGYDMTTEAGLAAFMMDYNRSLSSRPKPPSSLRGYDPLLVTKPIVREQHVGRNDPCPCGSGKKYKKCCLRG